MSSTAIYSVKNGHLVVELPLDDPRAFAEGVQAALKLMERWEAKKEENA